jgi:hypothetical protein
LIVLTLVHYDILNGQDAIDDKTVPELKDPDSVHDSAIASLRAKLRLTGMEAIDAGPTNPSKHTVRLTEFIDWKKAETAVEVARPRMVMRGDIWLGTASPSSTTVTGAMSRRDRLQHPSVSGGADEGKSGHEIL